MRKIIYKHNFYNAIDEDTGETTSMVNIVVHDGKEEVSNTNHEIKSNREQINVNINGLIFTFFAHYDDNKVEAFIPLESLIQYVNK